MKLFDNYNFDALVTLDKCLLEIEYHLRLLQSMCARAEWNETTRATLASNVQWLKRFYERAEWCVLNDKRQ